MLLVHPVLILSEKKDQWKCCIKPLIGVEHIRIILHAQSGSCYSAAYVVPLAPEFSPLICFHGSACAPMEHATYAVCRLRAEDVKPARLEVLASQKSQRLGCDDGATLPLSCTYSTSTAFNPLQLLSALSGAELNFSIPTLLLFLSLSQPTF